MIAIQAIGKYFDLNDQGQVINPANPEQLAPRLKAQCEQWITQLNADQPNTFESLYLRGSAALGYAVADHSDLDLMLFTVEGVSVDTQTLAKEYFNQDVDLQISCFNQNPNERNPRLDMVLKTQACCLWGRNYDSHLSDYQPGPDMLLALVWLKLDLEEAKPEPLSLQALAKVLIRSSFELVMAQDQSYTKSLYYCIEAFARHHRNQADELWHFLHCYLNPQTTGQADFDRMQRFGQWLLKLAVSQGYDQYIKAS